MHPENHLYAVFENPGRGLFLRRALGGSPVALSAKKEHKVHSSTQRLCHFCPQRRAHVQVTFLGDGITHFGKLYCLGLLRNEIAARNCGVVSENWMPMPEFGRTCLTTPFPRSTIPET